MVILLPLTALGPSLGIWLVSVNEWTHHPGNDAVMRRPSGRQDVVLGKVSWVFSVCSFLPWPLFPTK